MFKKKFGILGAIIAAALLVIVFVLRNANNSLNSETTVSKGQEKLKSGHYQEAISLFSDAISMDAGNYKAYFSRGIGYSKLGKFEIALKDFDKSIALSPENDKAMLLFLRGECYYQLNKFKKACADMKKAEQLGQPNAASFLKNYCD